MISEPQDLASGITVESTTSNSVTFNAIKISADKGVIHATATSSTPNCSPKAAHVVNTDPLPTTGNGNTATITGLTSGCPYIITLRSACADGSTVFATSAGAYETTQCTNPEAVTGANFDSATTSSLTLKSLTVENSGSYAKVQVSASAECTSDASADLSEQSLNENQLPYTFDSLLPGCLYSFTLAAGCSVGAIGTSAQIKKCTSKQDFSKHSVFLILLYILLCTNSIIAVVGKQ